MPQQNREAAGVLSKPIRDIYAAIKQLQQFISGATITVSGTVSVVEPVSVDDNGSSLTVDATTWPLPTGAATEASLAAAAASLSVVDDWDESDRAKVNPIAGQAGVQGGAGATTALTQRVVVVTDQTAIPVSGAITSSNKSANATLTSVAASVTSVTVLASNAARNSAIIHNDSATATLRLKYGATASATSFTGPPLRPGATAVIDDGYTGIIDGIWDIASGNARVTELTA